MQRRNFIKHSSLALGGLLLNNQLMSNVEHPPGEKITIGIIGCGDRGKGIMETLKELSDRFKITSICDIFDYRLKEAQKLGFAEELKEYTDYRKLLDDKNIQAVIIASPLHLHYAMAVDALNAGKHVYLEKTMTYSIQQAIDLVKLSKLHSNQILQVGHQLSYTPLYIKVKKMIESGSLGKVTQIDCRYDRNTNWRRPVPDPTLEKVINWRMYKAFSGGIAAELLSHQIEFINWAFNTHPDEIYAAGGIDFYKDGRDTYDNVQVMLRYNKDQIIGNFGGTCSNAREGYIVKIKGSKGTLELLMDEGVYYPEGATKAELQTVDGVAGATKIDWKKDGGIAITKEPMKEATWYAFQDFYRCIIEKNAPLSGVISGGTTAVTVHLANIALYTQTIQHWKPAYNF
ncbi:MAG: Gfo/Idh/MocA family oxidoreductase [Ferruginibacter sp.]